MADNPITLVCSACGQVAAPTAWRCTACGGVLEIEGLPPFDTDAIRTHEWSLWRYGAMLPASRRFSLGEGMTPLVPVHTGNGVPFLAKLEYLNPTSSYKDRGTAVMLNTLLSYEVEAVIEDLSGNAGASIAAYAAGIGMQARIFVPAAAPPAKKGMIARFGAEVVEVGGTRADVSAAVEQAAAETVYASHAWNSLFIAGQMTCAWEIWEQMSRRAPAAVVCPIGQGLLFLGLYRGFKALLDAGLIDRMPRLFGAQSAAYDPIVRAVESGAEDADPAGSGQYGRRRHPDRPAGAQPGRSGRHPRNRRRGLPRRRSDHPGGADIAGPPGPVRGADQRDGRRRAAPGPHRPGRARRDRCPAHRQRT